MANLPLHLLSLDFDFLAPLLYGDVQPLGIDLTIDRKTPMIEFMTDPSFQVGIMSISQYVIRTAQGERDFVGLPIFPTRVYRHRTFYKRRGSTLTDFKDLSGKRIGTNAWLDSGNTWSRAVMREGGGRIEDVDWWLGPLDNPNYDSFGQRPKVPMPANVHPLPPGDTLIAMFKRGELDGLVVPVTPKAFHEPDTELVRLFSDYVAAEKEYLKRVGFYPALSLYAVRRDTFEQAPWIARSLLDAFNQARQTWQASRAYLSDTSPWLEADMEELVSLMGKDWDAYGFQPNRRMLQTLCDEEFAQGLIEQPITPEALFADFLQATQDQ